MTDYVLAPPAQAAVPVEGEQALFPVRRILCVGRNYAAHRREMGGDDRDPPFFFSKPADALVPPGRDAAYPSATRNLHHEIELVVALKSGGADIPVDQALACVYGYAVGVDLTRRDLQNAAKDKGQPWESAKAFDASAPISAIRKWTSAPPQGRIAVSVNGQVRQDAVVADMIWNVAEIIAEASKLWTLAAGDLIYTGTPAGQGRPGRGRDRGCRPARLHGGLTMTLTLYSHWRATAPYRVRIGLALKGVAYEYVPVDLTAAAQHQAAYRAINPQRLVPALDLGDGSEPLTQSLAILEWLDETHPEPPLLPKAPIDAPGSAPWPTSSPATCTR
jgi:fumarylpyruvate hydrolase